MAHADISSIIEGAHQALPENMILVGEGTENERYVKSKHISGIAGQAGNLRMTDLVPRALETTGGIVSQPAGETESILAATARTSRFIQAGARLIPLSTEAESLGSANGIPVWASSPGSFTLIEGAPFAAGDELNPLTPSPLPIVTEEIDRDLIQSYGVRFELSRKFQKNLTADELNARLVNAIVFGIGRTVDRVALAALEGEITDTSPGEQLPSFWIVRAANAGLRFGELSAIVGTEGACASVENGELQVAGIPAELTGENAKTFVGAFDRAAVAVMDDIRVLVERLSVNGELAVTCWLDILPMVPDSKYFWRTA